MVASLPTPSPAAVSLPAAWELSWPHRHWRGCLEQGVVVITITTPQLLDDVLADGFFAELTAAITATGVNKVILDFLHVKSICAEAICPLHQLADSLRDRSGRLVLCGLCPYLAEVFHIDALCEGRSAQAPFATQVDVGGAVACLNQIQP